MNPFDQVSRENFSEHLKSRCTHLSKRLEQLRKGTRTNPLLVDEHLNTLQRLLSIVEQTEILLNSDHTAKGFLYKKIQGKKQAEREAQASQDLGRVEAELEILTQTIDSLQKESERTQIYEQENTDLKRRLKILGGELKKLRERNQHLENIEDENTKLKEELQKLKIKTTEQEEALKQATIQLNEKSESTPLVERILNLNQLLLETAERESLQTVENELLTLYFTQKKILQEMFTLPLENIDFIDEEVLRANQIETLLQLYEHKILKAKSSHLPKDQKQRLIESIEEARETHLESIFQPN